MSIAPTLQRYLTAENIQYDVIPHDPTMSSARTAEPEKATRLNDLSNVLGSPFRRSNPDAEGQDPCNAERRGGVHHGATEERSRHRRMASLKAVRSTST